MSCIFSLTSVNVNALLHEDQSKQVQQCSGNFKCHFKSMPNQENHMAFTNAFHEISKL